MAIIETTPTRRQVERTMRAMIASATSLPANRVIPGHESAPDPVDAYATLTMILNSRYGYPNYVYKVDSANRMTERAVQTRNAIYDLTFFGDLSEDYAQRLTSWLESETGTRRQTHDGIQFSSYTDIRQTDQILSEEWEIRSTLQLEVAYQVRTIDDIGWFDSVDIIVKEDDSKITETIEVNTDA